MGEIANRLNNVIMQHSCVNEYVRFHFTYLFMPLFSHFKINFLLARTLDTSMSKGYCGQDSLRNRAGPGPGEHSHPQAAWHPDQEGHWSWQSSLVEKGDHLGKPERDSRVLSHTLPDSCCPQLLVCQPCPEMSLSVCLSFQHCASACREMPSLVLLGWSGMAELAEHKGFVVFSVDDFAPWGRGIQG